MSIFAKLRIRIILITAITLAFILHCMLFLPLQYVYSRNLKQVKEFLQELQDTKGNILQEDGKKISNEKDTLQNRRFSSAPPKRGYFLPGEKENEYSVYYMHDIETESDYFCLKTDKQGNILECINEFNIKYEDDVVKAHLAMCLESPKDIGSVGCVFFNKRKTDEGYFIACVDRSETISYFLKTSVINTYAFFIFLAVGVLVALFFSHILVRPVEKIFLKQQQFVADASHELKTPIAAIRANIDVLESDMKGNKWFEYIKTENARMGKLVHDLLYLAKLDAKKEQVLLGNVCVKDILEKTVLPLEPLIYEEGKKLEFDSGKEDLYAIASVDLISQLLVILIDNAIKNSSKGDTIRITSSNNIKVLQQDKNFQKEKQNAAFSFLCKKKVYIQVFNTGSGICAKDLPKIFDRFYRADSSRTRTTGGYGLGLSIAKKLALCMNANLFAQSEEGKWAMFTICLPASRDI